MLHIHTPGMFNDHMAHSLYRTLLMATNVVSVMKMGNILPRDRKHISCRGQWSLLFYQQLLHHQKKTPKTPNPNHNQSGTLHDNE